MSQVAVSKASGVQAYIIKQWEAGRFRPPAAALEQLRAYYEAENVDLDAISEHLKASQAAPDVVPEAQPRQLGPTFTQAPRPGFFVSSDLPDELIGSLMERMEANDDRIAELTAQSFEGGFFGGASAATESNLRELMGTLAESYLLFRFLQGRNIVARTADQARDEPRTIGEYLRHWVHEKSAAASLFEADPTAPAAKPTRAAKRASAPVNVE